jgi:branched-chain amino acid aminotransferase
MSSTTSAVRFEYHPAKARMPAAERERLLTNPGFGRVFTEHMVKIVWREPNGWERGELVPYGPITRASLSPPRSNQT